MHQRRGEEPQRLARAEFQRIAFLNHQYFRVDAGEELAQHFQGHRSGNERAGGVFLQGFGDERRVVRFHVVRHQIIRRAAVEDFLQIGLPGVGDIGIGRIHYGDFFTVDDVGIVRHSLREDILAFEEVQREVIDPDIAYSASDLSDHLHMRFEVTNLRFFL